MLDCALFACCAALRAFARAMAAATAAFLGSITTSVFTSLTGSAFVVASLTGA